MLPVLVPVVGAISGGDTVREIANAHTLFNTTNTMIQLPLIGLLAALVTRLVSGKDAVVEHGPKFLDKRIMETPSIALGQVVKELVRMGQLANATLADAMAGFRNDPTLLEQARQKEKVVNQLEREVTDYLVVLSQRSLTGEQSEKINLYLSLVNDIERVGDHADNITELAEVKIDQNVPFSPVAVEDLEYMYSKVREIFEKAVQALKTEDLDLAREVIIHEDAIDRLEKELRKGHIRRLNEGTCYPGSGVVFLS